VVAHVQRAVPAAVLSDRTRRCERRDGKRRTRGNRRGGNG
jgi:hypothetical protein